MAFKSAILAAAALMATANAHIIMESPVPYSNDKIDNSPLSGAAQFPCKAQNGFTVTKMNSMKVGESQKVVFKGSAVHGGGSCQLSYTQDTTPTAKSVFKVIKSIEGGCPGIAETKAVDFTLPDSIPNGKGTFAWTWFSKLAGQPELYMNCAPIDVTGGASDASKLSALPDMLVANMASINTCKQVENKSIKFPSPGKELDAADSAAAPPTGQCGASGGSSSPPSGGSSPSGTPGSSKPSSDASKPTSAAGSSKPSSAAAQPSQTGGGVFAPSASSSAAQPTAAQPTAAQPTAAQPTTMATSAVAPSAPAGSASPPAATGSPSTGGSAGSCTQNGAIVCNGTTQFGLCNNGSVVFQPVAAGTQCSNGAITKRGYNGRIARPRAV